MRSFPNALQRARNFLGVKSSVTYTEITKAYRARAKQLHPDYNKDPRANEQFAVLVEAYKMLMNHRSYFQKTRYKTKMSRGKTCYALVKLSDLNVQI